MNRQIICALTLLITVTSTAGLVASLRVSQPAALPALGAGRAAALLHESGQPATPTMLPPIDPTPRGGPIAVGTPLAAPERSSRAIEPENVTQVVELSRFPLPVSDEEAVIAFTTDGAALLTRINTSVLVRLMPTGLVRGVVAGAYGSQFGDLVISPDGGLFAAANQHVTGRVEAWDLAAGVLRREQVGGLQIRRLRFSSDGRHLMAVRPDGRENLQVWDVASGALRYNLDLSLDWSFRDLQADANPRSDLIATSTLTNTVLIRELATGEVSAAWDTGYAAPWHITMLRFSPDGRRLAAVLDNGQSLGDPISHAIVVWQDGRLVDTMTFDGASDYWFDGFAWSPDGSWLTITVSGGNPSPYSARVWLWRIGRKSQEILSGDNRHAQGLAPSPDGRLLAIGWTQVYANAQGKFPAETVLWDADAGRVVRRLSGLAYPSFSPDQSLLVVRGDGVADAALHRFALDPQFVPTAAPPSPTPTPPDGHWRRSYLPALARE